MFRVDDSSSSGSLLTIICVTVTSKFKHWLRKAAQRTTEAVYEAIAPILKTVSPTECANYFANAGYDQT
jgi:hypothetical protein